MRIKRTKAGPSTFPAAPVLVHYATAIDPSGAVQSWTTDKTAGGVFSPDELAKVRAHYAARSGAGTLDFVPVNEPAQEPAKEPEKQPEPKSGPRKGRHTTEE